MKKLILLTMIAAGVLSACTVVRHNTVNQLDSTGINFTTAKKGVDCGYNLFGFISLSNANADQAAKKAKITSLKYLTESQSNYFLVTKECVIAYGN